MTSISSLATILLISTSTFSKSVLADQPPLASHRNGIKGLDPSKTHLYMNDKGTFTCLDGSKTIKWSAVNDDYCDCPDGSDEPGTSACPNSTFYCMNLGHLPGVIRSNQVGDGLCESACCDGSDEAPGVCPNLCGEQGAAFRAEREALIKKRKTGAKIRNSYISFAKKETEKLKVEREKLRKEVQDLATIVKVREGEVERLEKGGEERLERKKKTPLYTSLLSHRLALSRLRAQHEKMEQRLKTLEGIMTELAAGYNPNYQDMAVKAAVVGFNELMGVKKEGSEEASSEVTAPTGDEEEPITDGELDELENLDLVTLLMKDEDDSGSDSDASILFNLPSYIPDQLLESFEFMRGGLVYWLVKLGIVDKYTKSSFSASSASSGSAAHAREEFNKLQESLNDLRSKLQQHENDLNDLETRYGPDAEWKKLKDTCIEKDMGEYTYSVCFFGQAWQKSNKDGSKHNLGHFSSWNYDQSASEGTEAYYSKQLYDNGAKCWNGPNRSVRLQLECALDNALTYIVEEEKCEYLFKGTSPALCWPMSLDDESGDVKVEPVSKDEL